MTKVPLIKYMFRSDWKALTDALHSGTPYEYESFELANDLTTFLSGTNFGLIVASLKTKDDLIQLATLVKTLKKSAPGNRIKIIVINLAGNKQFEKVVANLDLDLLEENIQPKALRFKIDFMMKSIHAKMKNDPTAAAANNVNSLQDNTKVQEKKVNDKNPIWTEPLECEDDIWLLRNEIDCKKILTRWLVRLIGPSPYVASWVDSGTPGVWKFEFKSEKTIFMTGTGSWYYRGDQKPDFVWAENVWSFTGSSFDLFYKDGPTTFHRLNFKDKKLAIAKNSQYAKTKERSIIESFDKDLVFKKVAQVAEENKSFETEQNKFKNLEGKNKTENLDQGPLSGKGKTDSLEQGPLSGKARADAPDQGPLSGKSKTDLLDQGPLSGKGKTSNINIEPLAMDLKKDEAAKSLDPHAQKTSTKKGTSFWKGKNEYEKDESKGNLDAPSTEGFNPGSELALDSNSKHETHYKNHNEAEKFAAKDIGHSIKKDGVSENLKGKTDPTKSSSKTGSPDLEAKSSTDQLDGHLTSPNAKKEKSVAEKADAELAGKSSTDKIAGHLSSSNAKKDNDKKDDKKELYRNASNHSNSKKAETESEELENELNGTSESEGFNNKQQNANEKAKANNMVGQLDALRLKKEKSEKEKQKRSATDANSKESGSASEGVVDKISTTYSSKKNSSNEKENESSGNVLPFIEKEKIKVEPESLGSKELDNAVLTARVTSFLIQDSVRIDCTLDDFFERTIIFSTNQNDVLEIKPIILNLNFNYMDKNTNLKFNGNVVACENDGEGFKYITVEISAQNATDFNAFMKRYNTRQENINFFLNAVKG